MNDITKAAEELRLEIASAFSDKQGEDIAIGLYISARTEERELQLKFFGWATNVGYVFSYELDKWFDGTEHEEGITTSELFEIFLKETTTNE